LDLERSKSITAMKTIRAISKIVDASA